MEIVANEVPPFPPLCGDCKLRNLEQSIGLPEAMRAVGIIISNRNSSVPELGSVTLTHKEFEAVEACVETPCPAYLDKTGNQQKPTPASRQSLK